MLLAVQGLTTHFSLHEGLLKAVDDVEHGRKILVPDQSQFQ